MSSTRLRTRVGRQAALYGIGLIMGRALSLISLPILTQLLTPADYGVIALIEMTFDVLTIVAGSRIAQGVFHFYHKAGNDADRNAVLSTSLILIFATYSSVAATAWFAAPRLSELLFDSERYTGVIRIAALSFPWQGMFRIPMDYLRLRDSAGTYVTLGFAKSLIQLLFLYILLSPMGLGVEGVFISTLIANTLIGGGLVIWLIRQVGLRYARSTGADLVRFGMPLVLTQIATFFTTFGDRYFLQASTDETTVGIYALAYNFGFLLFMLGYSPFGSVWDPVRFEVAKRPNYGAVISRAFVHMNILLFTMAVGIALFVGDFLRVISDPAFWGAATFVPVILVAYILQGWSAFHDVGILVREKTRYITVANWAAALSAGLGYALLIPLFGGWGAASATAVAFAIRSFLTYTYAQRLWPIEFDWRPVLRLIVIAVVIVAVGLFLPRMGLVPSLLIRSGLVVLYLAGVWFADIIPSEERTLFERWIREPGRASRQIAEVMRGRRPAKSG